MSFSSLWGYGRAMALATALTALPALAQDQNQNQANQQDDQFSQQSNDQFSQQSNQQLGQQSNQQFGQQGQYNQGTETTLEGTVVSVNPNTPSGEHVIVDTSQGQYDVHLGPQWYLQQQQASLQPGQRISVTGSESNINNQQAIIARQVTANGNTVTLRTASGIPLWSGAQRGAFGQQGVSGQQGQFSQSQQQGQFAPYAPEEENPLAYEQQGAPQAQQGQFGQPAQQGQFGQQQPYAMQQGQYGPYTSTPSYQQGQFGGYQQSPYTMQQGQYGQQQPPLQQTPYMGQPGPFSQGQPMNIGISNWQRGDIYNPFTETTLNGTVQQVRQCACGPFSSTYATLNTSQGKVIVQLAPSSYLSQNQVQINRGEHIQVTGSRLNVNGNQVVLARVVSTPQRTVALRNTQGMPQWTAAGQVGQMQQPGFAGTANPSTDNPEEF